MYFFQAFQRELGSHQKSVDAINTSGQHLLTEVLDTPSPTKEQLDELNEMWAEICNKSLQKQDRLQQAMKVSACQPFLSVYLCDHLFIVLSYSFI